ncbi:MAG: OPT/YSL family transporter [Phycisphaerae bacterium]
MSQAIDSNVQHPPFHALRPQASVLDHDDRRDVRTSVIDQMEATFRALLTGAVIAGAFAIFGIYLGLRVGLNLNLSIPATLIAVGFWRSVHTVVHTRRPFSMLEANITQTTASAGSSVAGAGLVGAIPAYLILENKVLSFGQLTLWIATVCLVGIVAAALIRRQLIVNENLPFVVGVASAETLRELYASGAEAARRTWILISAALASAATTVLSIPSIAVLPAAGWALPFSIAGVPVAAVHWHLLLQPLFLGIGGLIGPRLSASLLLGALLSTAVAIPMVKTGGDWQDLKSWLGVTAMFVGSLVGFAFSWRSILLTMRSLFALQGIHRVIYLCVAATALLAVIVQIVLFGISWWLALLGIAMALMLALISGRIAGEVGIIPSAPLAKSAQLLFGAAAPSHVATNTMAASMAAGAASQGADLLYDLKCGALIGASRHRQFFAQVCGAMIGTFAACIFFVTVINQPEAQLGSGKQFPAPGVDAVRNVAELIRDGGSALPVGSISWILLFAAGAAMLAVAERLSSERVKIWVPSPVSIGLGLLIPASYSLLIFAGGIIAFLVRWKAPKWFASNFIVVCTGVIIGAIFAELFDIGMRIVRG